MADRENLEVKQMVILMIWGDALDPANVFQLLGFTGWQPQQSWRKGDHLWAGELDGSRRLLDDIQTFGAIRLWPKREWLSSDLVGQIQRWSEVLSSRANYDKKVQTSRCNVRYLIGEFTTWALLSLRGWVNSVSIAPSK